MELHIDKPALLALLRSQLALARSYDTEGGRRLAAAEAAWLKNLKRETRELAAKLRAVHTADDLAASSIGNGRYSDGDGRYSDGDLRAPRLDLTETPPRRGRLVAPRIARAVALIEADNRDTYRIREGGKDNLIYWAATWAPETA